MALLIPASRQLEQTKRIPAREVLLPIAHVTTLAGSATLIGTSSNLVIAGIAGERGVHETDLNPGETCYVAGESEEAVARNPAVALWQTATSRAPQQVMQPGGYTQAQFARSGAPILAACLVTVCGVAYVLL